jgi:hypothetical protein
MLAKARKLTEAINGSVAANQVAQLRTQGLAIRKKHWFTAFFEFLRQNHEIRLWIL